MGEDTTKYLAAGHVYTRDELKTATESQAADLPPETWRDGVFNFDDYLIESLQTGTITMIDDESDDL
jgi:hypothetical protein